MLYFITSPAHSHTPNLFCFTGTWQQKKKKKKLISLDRLDYRYTGGEPNRGTHTNISTYPSVHPSLHLSVQAGSHCFSWQGCCSVWRAHWQAKESSSGLWERRTTWVLVRLMWRVRLTCCQQPEHTSVARMESIWLRLDREETFWWKPVEPVTHLLDM